MIFFLTKKNCEKINNGTNPVLQKNAEFEDQGYYTCVFSIPHNGKLFNVTKTINVTIVGGKRNVRIGKKEMYLMKQSFLSSNPAQESRGNLFGVVTASLAQI